MSEFDHDYETAMRRSAKNAVRRYSLPRDFADDLTQDGIMACLEAEKRYDPERGSMSLSHFARWHGAKEINRIAKREHERQERTERLL